MFNVLINVLGIKPREIPLARFQVHTAGTLEGAPLTGTLGDREGCDKCELRAIDTHLVQEVMQTKTREECCR